MPLSEDARDGITVAGLMCVLILVLMFAHITDHPTPQLIVYQALLAIPPPRMVISYGLYGQKVLYSRGMIQNAILARTVYPGWEVWVYHDNTVPIETIQHLREIDGVVLIDMTNATSGGAASGMFWRFLVAIDNTVDRYIIRDTDCRLNWRERRAVKEWENSNKSFHLMRDHPNHHGPMLGGLWGGVKGALPQMKEWIARSPQHQYGADMKMLREFVWPLTERNHVTHDSFFCEKYEGTTPFPTQRSDSFEHVGQTYEEDGTPRKLDIDCCKQHTPVKCRKDENWLYG